MAQVLRQLQVPTDPNILVGTATFDDAGVYRISDELALVQTLDFFPPLVDDPFDFGRIAAANALSDVYAMGGEPLTALNIVGWPDKELPLEWLGEILRGGAEIVAAAGAVTIGGHSVRDAEVKFGLSVTGRVHPQRIWTNAGARPGDVLVLSKPIGSGILTTAAKQGKCAPEELAEAVAVMTTLNRGARDAGVQIGVSACTDITGFGLLGHAFEMADASKALVTIHSAAVPLLQRALEFARAGVLTRVHKSTREHLGVRLRVDGEVDPALAGALLDAQTSGGLLFSVPAERAAQLVNALQAAQTPSAAIIGDVSAARDDVRVRLAR